MARPILFSISVVSGILVCFIHPLPVHTQGQDGSCVPEIKVRKNTVHTASREHQLNIMCPVTYCKESPVFKWYKIGAENKYTDIIGSNQVKIAQEPTGLNGIISYLSFENISTDDTGVYRCMISTSNFSSESHNIKVNVSDSSDHANANNTSGIPGKVSDVRWLLYVFICLGIPVLVLIVMLISFLCINRCSRKANSRRHKNATFSPKPLSTTTTRGKTQEFPKEENNLYDAPSDDLHSETLYIQNDQECTPDTWNGNSRGDGNGLRQIVYATLQHPTPREPPAVRHQSREQLSEYASIRIG
ncbi:B- and T-lymphocyte attenuator-like [Neoarius graeffei]|uniref:B- and T-lymphocyte attenuator-like n=1 Tax=Neoarius graeffei TaxID=443677 RepID=UPI00298BC984|nr:B- and T-lymphocyte attenuator-like [Neoarius graeffei]